MKANIPYPALLEIHMSSIFRMPYLQIFLEQKKDK